MLVNQGFHLQKVDLHYLHSQRKHHSALENPAKIRRFEQKHSIHRSSQSGINRARVTKDDIYQQVNPVLLAIKNKQASYEISKISINYLLDLKIHHLGGIP